MPAAYHNCPFCGERKRSDYMKAHLQAHEQKLKADCPPAWMKLEDRNIYVSVLPRENQAAAHDTGVCFDCMRVLDKPRTEYYKRSSLQYFEQHVCRERSFQGVRPAKTTKPKESATPGVPTNSPSIQIHEVDANEVAAPRSGGAGQNLPPGVEGPEFDDQQLCKAVLEHFSDNKAIKKRIQYFENEYDDGDETDHELILQAVMDGGDPEEEMKLRDELWQIKQERDHLAKQLLEEREEQRLALKKQAEFFMKKFAEKDAEIHEKRLAINHMSEELAMFNGCTPEEVLDSVGKAIGLTEE